MSAIPKDIIATVGGMADTEAFRNGVDNKFKYFLCDGISRAILAERERCAKIAEDYSAMEHATFDIKRENFPQKSPDHTFIAAKIREA